MIATSLHHLQLSNGNILLQHSTIVGWDVLVDELLPVVDGHVRHYGVLEELGANVQLEYYS